MNSRAAWTIVAALGCLWGSPVLALDGKAGDEPSTIKIADDHLKITIPDGWEKKEPRTRIVEHEFAVPPAEGDEQSGRVTIMAAGGSIEDNISRWVGQFSQADGSSTRDKTKVEKKTVAGQEITVVDISGTYDDKAGPFVPGPGVKRENYRLLGAIIETKHDDKPTGNYFIKFYGPAKTVGGQDKAFTKMIDGVQAN